MNDRAALDQWTKSEAKILQLDPLIHLPCRDHIYRLACEGIWVKVVEAYRDSGYQKTLWLKGRDNAGRIVDESKIVTRAPPGFSVHEYRLAYDLAPDGVTINEYGLTPEEALVDGKVSWPAPVGRKRGLWEAIARCGRAVGMTAGADFKSITDWPHFEWTGGLTIHDLRAGKRPHNGPYAEPEEFPLENS